MEKSYKVRLDKTLGDIYGIDIEEYRNFLVSSVQFFSRRTLNCLNKKGIKTVKMLLELSPNELFRMDGFGNKCFTEIKQFCEDIISQNDINKKNLLYNYEKYLNSLDIYKARKNKKKPATIFLLHALDMARGDFSFLEKSDISSKRKEEIEIYKKAYQILGEDLAVACVKKDPYILDLLKNLKNYEEIANYHFKIHELLKRLPEYRKNNSAIPYINAYTLSDELREILKKTCRKSNATLNEIVNNLEFDNEILYLEVFRFLEWCNFDLNLEITKLFSSLYKDEREKEVIERRAKNQTLQEIGKIMGITRERVRQIEVKIKKKFSDIHKEIRIISKICAERNGDMVLTPFEIEKYCGENFEVLMFLLREYKGINYIYDKQLDVFVIGNESIKEYAEKYVEELPDIIHESQLIKIRQEVSEIENITEEMVEKVFHEAYTLTGHVYHRCSLSLALVYENILKKYYPDGMKIYDSDEIVIFRNLVKKEYGDIKLPKNDRALSARVASTCILCDRGKYKVKQKKYISKELSNAIFKYIDENENIIFVINTIFYIFEKELVKEGITNKYYLYGILKELYSDKFIFTRDYISKDISVTSLYSSILNYIKSSNYPVTKEQIRRDFPGITEIMITLATGDENILNYFGEYLHSSKLRISEEEKNYFYNLLANILNDEDPHHCKEIYDKIMSERSEILTRNAILYPFSIFSLLEYLFKEKFQFSRPYIARKNVTIGRAKERLLDIIYAEEEFTISDISEFVRENRFQMRSILDFINECNDEFLLINSKVIKKISTIGINQEIALMVEDIILKNLTKALPIREVLILKELPKLRVSWTDWLIYSIINKWGKKLEVLTSSNQFRLSVPIIAPLGKMSISEFSNLEVKEDSELNQIDNLHDIDSLLEDFIDIEDLFMEDEI